MRVVKVRRLEMEICPECKRKVKQLFKKGNRIACAYCFGNLWAINKEREASTIKQGT